MNEAPPDQPQLVMDGIDDPVPNRVLAWTEVLVAALISAMAVLLAIFMPALIGAGGFETAEDYLHLTPDFFPRLTMVLLAAVSMRYLVGAVRDLARSTGRHDADDLRKLGRAGFMVVVALCYAAIISSLGFIAATMLVTVVVSYFLGLRNPLAFVPGVVIVPIAIRFIFERLLFIALPRSDIDSIAAIEDAVIGLLVKFLL